MFVVFDQGDSGLGIATIPEFLCELGRGIWLTVKGFKPSAIAATYDRDAGHGAA